MYQSDYKCQILLWEKTTTFFNVKEKNKNFWSYIKLICKTRDKVCDLMQWNGELTVNNKEIGIWLKMFNDGQQN